MLLWGSESLDEVLERDWKEEEEEEVEGGCLVEEKNARAQPLHVQVKGNMQVPRNNFPL